MAPAAAGDIAGGWGSAPAGCPGTTRGDAGKPENASADAPERRALEPLRGRDAGAGRAQRLTRDRPRVSVGGWLSPLPEADREAG